MPSNLPFVRSVYQPSLTVADLLLRSGDQQADAERRRGEIAAQMWSGIGNAIGQLPGQIAQAKRSSADDVTRNQQQELGALQLTSAKRADADVTAMDAAFKQPDRDSILNSLPGHLRPAVMKQFTEADTSAAKLTKLHGEIEQANNEYLAGLGQSVAEHGYNLGAAGIALQHARNTYERTNNTEMLKQIDAVAAQLSQDPNSLKDVADRLISLSPKRSEMMQTMAHQSALETQAATSSEETARHNAAIEAIQKQTGDRQAATATETARHNQEMERLRGAQITQSEAAPDLSPEALTLTAKQYAMTGQLPPMGMGKTGAAVRTKIINEAAKQYAGLDLPTQVAAYKANQESLKKIQTQADAMKAFEATAGKNMDVFLGLASKVVDTGSPILNKQIRAIDASVLGGEDQAAFNVALRTVIPEYAKILSNPGLSGQLSDSARKEIEQVVSGNATMGQLIASAKILKQDTANRRQSYDDQISDIQKRIATPPGQQPAAAVPVGETWIRDGNGKLVKKGG